MLIFIVLACSVIAFRSSDPVLSDTDESLSSIGEALLPQEALHGGLQISRPQEEPEEWASTTIYSAMLDSLNALQEEFYTCAIGAWPEAIDWTAEVMASQVSGTLFAISDSGSENASTESTEVRKHENLINRYFTHLTSFYFGEDAFGLRTQAYDDMLWVVLNWLEGIKFVNMHSNLYYGSQPSKNQRSSEGSSWYARQFIPQFAHRARLFYNLASRGWDTTLCGGGMVWNSRLAPYKNAITNELFIAASIWMYLYFPGDDNASPFELADLARGEAQAETVDTPAKAHDSRYLSNAIAGYDWLKSSGMRNSEGLYADGFHVTGWRGGRHPSNGTKKCDLRQEEVYTYNQGVVLSGLRGLWEATGNRTYLEDGHELIRVVISASGWAHRDNPRRKWDWAGLGRGGVLEEACDWSGMCNQDGQTFKGIFFWHFSSFCAPLPTSEDDSDGWFGRDRPWLSDKTTRALHRQSCEVYEAWVKRNAEAAWVTKDQDGLMGAWWGRPARPEADEYKRAQALRGPLSQDDYKNKGVPFDEIWQISIEAEDRKDEHEDRRAASNDRWAHQSGFPELTEFPHRHDKRRRAPSSQNPHTTDLNDRGRGRTVETQSGGVAVLRAAWKLAVQRQRWQRNHP